MRTNHMHSSFGWGHSNIGTCSIFHDVGGQQRPLASLQGQSGLKQNWVHVKWSDVQAYLYGMCMKKHAGEISLYSGHDFVYSPMAVFCWCSRLTSWSPRRTWKPTTNLSDSPCWNWATLASQPNWRRASCCPTWSAGGVTSSALDH